MEQDFFFKKKYIYIVAEFTQVQLLDHLLIGQSDSHTIIIMARFCGHVWMGVLACCANLFDSFKAQCSVQS